MSGTDYTTTTNYGLYKPLPNADINQWGSHLNLNADTLDGVLHGFLPLSGGTPLTGPLIYTATGGTTPRSAQDRAADVANVLDYGADPTGVADSSSAINDAAAQVAPNGRNKSVYLPGGTYQINHQIILTAGQGLFGDAPGNTVLNITDAFDPAASSVVHCATSAIDPGPCISNVMFQFIQPSDQASRSNYKTLAAGGTSHTGGTGVQYPWCIDTSGQSRITLLNVSITGSWNGINANGTCFWISGLRICALNIGIGIGGTVATPVADWAHLSDIEFYPFGLNTTQSQSVYMDGTTIAMQIGAQNGLTAQNISCFYSRLVFTSDASNGWFAFTNLSLDADGATMEVANAAWLQIAGFYTTAGTTAGRPAVNVSNGQVIIDNWHSHSGSAQQTLLVTGGDVTVASANITRSDTTVYAALVNGGTLRMNGCKIYAQMAAAYTQALIAQAGTGNLQVDNVEISGAAGSSGAAVLVTTDNALNSIGRVILGANWTVAIPPGFKAGSYAMAGPLTITTSPVATNAQLELLTGANANSTQSKLRFHGTFPTGTDYFPYLAAGLRGGWSSTGWNGSYLGVWLTNAANGAGSDANMIQIASFTPGGMFLPTLPTSTTYANDAAAATGGVAVGQLYRNGSAVQVRVS